MDGTKVKKVMEAYLGLNDVERQTFFVLVTTLNELQTPKKAEPPHRPDPRGRYKCSLCDKTLPTKRGRSIHMKAHDRRTAPANKESK